MKHLILLIAFIISNQAYSEGAGTIYDVVGALGSSQPRSSSTEKIKNKLTGSCTLIIGNAEFTTSPCINTLLKLEGKNKDEVYFSRTSSTGAFEFLIPKEGRYKIGVKSKLYEVVSPLEELNNIKNINLQLRQIQLNQSEIKK